MTERKTRAVTIPTAAKYIDGKPYTIRQLIWSGKLPSIQVVPGGKIYIDLDDLDRLLDENKRRAIG